MKRQTIIIVITPGKEPEAWGNLKKTCKNKGYCYNTLSKQKMPIKINDTLIYRVKFL